MTDAQRPPMQRAGDDMDLPEGKTCNDCVHCRRCCVIFGHIPQDERCDWSPSRFQEKQKPVESREDKLFKALEELANAVGKARPRIKHTTDGKVILPGEERDLEQAYNRACNILSKREGQ